MIDAEDHREIRCRRLGHPVTFRYCRTQEGERLCPLILHCWWEQFDVAGFLRAHIDVETMQRLLGSDRPQPKVASIVELIAQARSRQNNGDETDSKGPQKS